MRHQSERLRLAVPWLRGIEKHCGLPPGSIRRTRWNGPWTLVLLKARRRAPDYTVYGGGLFANDPSPPEASPLSATQSQEDAASNVFDVRPNQVPQGGIGNTKPDVFPEGAFVKIISGANGGRHGRVVSSRVSALGTPVYKVVSLQGAEDEVPHHALQLPDLRDEAREKEQHPDPVIQGRVMHPRQIVRAVRSLVRNALSQTALSRYASDATVSDRELRRDSLRHAAYLVGRLHDWYASHPHKDVAHRDLGMTPEQYEAMLSWFKKKRLLPSVARRAVE